LKRITVIFIFIFLLIFNSCSSKTSPSKSNADSQNIIPTASASKNQDQINQTTPAVKDITPESSSTVTPQKNPENASNSEANVSNKERSWFYKPNKAHITPEIPADVNVMLKKYNGYYVGDTDSKVLYLTFDEGYENGFTPKILDILKENNVKAAFFVTRPYIKQQPDLIKRMVQEGHIVGNHSSTHPSMTTKAGNVESFNKEFTDTEKVFTDITGLQMPKYFRPPMGVYSEKTLELTKTLGYISIFWSFAHKDWEVNNQPSVQVTHDKVINGSHNGEIILLHAVSKSDTDALDSIIKDLKKDGYVFLTLDELK
jgi:peptidoglycan-N-acetylmuramic acid deacetylase